MVLNTNILSVTANTTVSLAYSTYLISATGGNITMTLPPIVNNGMNYVFNRTDTTANTVTIQSTGGQFINDSTSINLPRTSSLELQSFNNAWYNFPSSFRGASGPAGTGTNQQMFFNSGPSTGTGGTIYILPYAIVTDELQSWIVMSRNSTISNLFVGLNVGNTGGGSRIFTVLKNSAATTLTTTLTTGVTGTNSVNTFTVVAGDYIALRMTSTGAPSPAAQIYAVLNIFS